MTSQMGAGAQQPPSVYYIRVQEGRQPQIVFHTESGVSNNDLYHRKTHKFLGFLQMTNGALCFLMELIGMIVGPTSSLLWCGFYAGVFFFIAGGLGYLAYRRNSRGFLVGCLVMSSMAPVVAVIGIIASLMEMYVIDEKGEVTASLKFQKVKESFIISCCVVEIVESIIQASFACVSCCRCCWPESALTSATALPDSIVYHHHSQLNGEANLASGLAQPLPTKTLPQDWRQGDTGYFENRLMLVSSERD